jgi:hypothetical protein
MAFSYGLGWYTAQAGRMWWRRGGCSRQKALGDLQDSPRTRVARSDLLPGAWRALSGHSTWRVRVRRSTGGARREQGTSFERGSSARLARRATAASTATLGKQHERHTCRPNLRYGLDHWLLCCALSFLLWVKRSWPLSPPRIQPT